MTNDLKFVLSFFCRSLFSCVEHGRCTRTCASKWLWKCFLHFIYFILNYETMSWSVSSFTMLVLIIYTKQPKYCTFSSRFDLWVNVFTRNWKKGLLKTSAQRPKRRFKKNQIGLHYFGCVKENYLYNILHTVVSSKLEISNCSFVIYSSVAS